MSASLDLSVVNPERLREAALSLGFREVDSFDHNMSSYALFRDEEWSVFDAISVPRSSGTSAFVRLAEDALERMARLAGLPMRDVLTLVATGNADVFKVRATEAESGTVPLAAFAKMAKRVEQVMRDLARASFRELIIRQRERMTQVAQDRFMRELQAGQTQFGSYVVTVLSPLGQLHVAEGQLDVGTPESPLARSINLAMSRQLVDLSGELAQVAAGKKGLDEAVVGSRERTGIVADTCLRLSEMIAEVESGFEIALVPSPAVRMGSETPSLRAAFHRPQQPLLEQAAKLLTPVSEDSKAFTIKGVVTDTHQEAGREHGDTYVKVRGLILAGKGRNGFRTVRVQVTAEQRHVAAEAWKHRHVVLVEGELADPYAKHWATQGPVKLTPVADERWEDILPRPDQQ